MSASDDLDDILDSALDGFDVTKHVAPAVHVKGTAAPVASDAAEKSGGAASASAAGDTRSAEQTAAEDALRAFEEALKPLSEPVSGACNEEADMEMVAEFVKSIEKLGILGDTGAPAPGGPAATNGAASEIESAIKSLISDVLSKDVLQEPMQQIRNSLSVWLTENSASLPVDERSRHERQLKLVTDICGEFEGNADSARIIDLLASLKDCGKLPSEVMSELPDDEEGVEHGDLEQMASNCPVQ